MRACLATDNAVYRRHSLCYIRNFELRRETSTQCYSAYCSEVEAVMRESDDLISPRLVDYETWSDSLRSAVGRHNLHGIEPNTFAGWVRPLSVSGLMALDICCRSGRVERACGDVGPDGLDRYKVCRAGR
jgi:hypothetical protein